SWRRAAKVLDRLEPLLKKLHERGWVWRDAKPSHVLARGGQYFLLDFENACRCDEQSIDAWSSRNYRPPEFAQRTHRPPGMREDDYSLGVIAFQFLAGKFPPRSQRLRAQVYRRTRCPDSLRARIERLFAPS
ncbi:MAG: serine/threonine-protein kinase, partial [Verrucomicrobiota bacterium]|nr:serine/threonine-protein kinase [Verrucomicrobiota bacterium]